MGKQSVRVDGFWQLVATGPKGFKLYDKNKNNNRLKKHFPGLYPGKA